MDLDPKEKQLKSIIKSIPRHTIRKVWTEFLYTPSRYPYIILLASFLFLGCYLSSDSKNNHACQGKIEPDMQCIPEGEFIRGSNLHEPNEKPESKIYLNAFFIDTYEVTNEAFNRCIEAGKCQDCLKTKKCDFVGARYGKIYQRPKQPVVGVSWYTAVEYCSFMNKRLPTEAEWEKAARGSEGDPYPWGSREASCENAVIEENGRKGCFQQIAQKPHWMTTDDVGTKPPGHYGLYDMAGNSWEWVSDWYSNSYSECGIHCNEKNPKGPCNGDKECPGHTKKIVKGGSWWWPGVMARGSYRRPHVPENFPEYHHFGFRCAKDSL